ncbi:integrase [Streptomyces kronopolitis]|uniref:integrase n=1 Tax=Streptomyces kronopolitis TaxID=1612435 RepID=UPI003D987D81
MNRPLPRPRVHPAFADDEPVLASHTLLPDARSPLFGNSETWCFNGVLRRPANLTPGGWKLMFTRFEGPWKLRAREVAMIELNPRHPLVPASGIPAPRRPNDPRSIVLTLNALRNLAAWAAERGLSADLKTWRDHHMHAYLAHLKERMAADTALTHVKAVRELHRCGPLLTGGGLPTDPWQDMSSRAAAGVTWTKTAREIVTPVIPPEIWFPLVNAAWTYIDRFGPDIIEANRIYENLRDCARVDAELSWLRLRRWLDDGHCVPLHHAHEPGGRNVGGIHWSLLAWQIGFDPSRSKALGTNKTTARELALAAVARGQCRPASLLDSYATVTRPDGSTGHWHPGLDPRCLQVEIRNLRVACFVFVTALSMMRDGEVHEITKGSVVQHYGAPAITSALIKGQEDFPVKHWWIIEPVARAIATAEELTPHPERIFTGVRSRTDPGETFSATESMAAFIRHINAMTALTGLEPIPEGRVSPHMFRRTMSMLTDQFPGSEIALGIQLKHAAARALANRTTQGYAATAASWAKHLDQAVEAARFRNLRELFDTHKAGRPIGFGPGAEQLSRTFDKIRDTVTAQGGDATVEDAMLKKARISIRFGTLNNCLFDAANPVGALCLENAVIPPGHTGPLPDRCRPERCGNSMLGVQHVAIWDSEDRTLLKLLDTPGLPAGRRAALEQQRADVHTLLRKVPR